MGFWGTALYSGDFAMDLRATISAVARLPFDIDRLIDILCETEPSAASNPADEEHTTFWLVLADQFAKRGIVSERVREKALDIIRADDDLGSLTKLGMKPAEIRKRRQMLGQLRERILSAPIDKPRAILNKPQPLLMETGDVVVYPTCAGKCINPYFASKEQDRQYTKDGPRPWTQDGWAAAVIIDCGRAFDFLAWYRPLTIVEARSEKPSLESLHGEVLWKLETPGTCSPSHLKKLELQKIGMLPIDAEKLKRIFSNLRPGISAAVSDISIANRLNVFSQTPAWAIPQPGGTPKGRTPTIIGIEHLLRNL
jgi:hypothetical protein